MSYLITGSEMSLAEKERRRRAAVVAGKEALVKQAVVQSPDSAVARDADYSVDFVPVATAVGLTGWLTMPLAVIAGIYSVFADNVPAALTPQVPNNQVWVFYGIHILTANDPITQIFFGTGRSNIRKAQFDLEKMYTKMETDGYFSQEVVFYPQEIATVTVRARLATGVGCRVVLDTLIVEPLQVSVA